MTALALLMLTVGFAGCIGDAGEGELGGQRQAATDEPDAPETRQIEFGGSAEFPLATVDVCGVSGCLPINDQGPRVFQEDPEGTVTDAQATLTWEPSSPVMQELAMAFVWACGEDTCQSDIAVGTSPLELEATGIEASNDVLLVVDAPRLGTQEANLKVTHMQEIHAEGSLTLTGASGSP